MKKVRLSGPGGEAEMGKIGSAACYVALVVGCVVVTLASLDLIWMVIEGTP